MDPILASLDRLTRRARRLDVLRFVAWVGVLSLVTASVSAVALTLGASRLLAQGMGLVALGGLLALVVVLVRAWVRAGDVIEQARRAEVAVPTLRSRLLTALQGQVGAGPDQVSQVLLQRAARQAGQVLSGVAAARVHPLSQAQPALLALGLASAGAGLVGLLSPVGPLDALVVALGGSAAGARLADAGADVSAERAVVGDIVLRYIFPDYTGIDPVEVPNSDGTIHAPPGTRVVITARTETPFQSAALQVDEGEPVDAELSEGRDLSTSLTVEQDGAWRFLLFSGDQVVRSPDYKIVAEADAPPVVSLVRPPEFPVPVDMPLGFGWQVQDDYGIKRVVIELRQGEQVREVELRAPVDLPTNLQGGVRSSPRDLGLSPGDQVQLRVLAYDNDVLGGSKAGASAVVDLQVTGPRGRGVRLSANQRRLRDVLIPVLADFLEEPTPPARGDAAMTRWAVSVRERFDPVDTVVEAWWGDATPTGLVGARVQNLLQQTARLVRFTLTTYDPSSPGKPTASDLDTFAALHADVVSSLELTIFVLDKMLQKAALEDLAEAARDLALQARELADMPQDAEAQALLARLDQLQRLMAAMSAQAARLSEGQLKEFVNSRAREVKNMMDEIRKAIAEGRMDDARAMLEQLAQQVEQMAEGLEEQAAAQQQGEDKLAQAIEETVAQLEKLQAEQQALAEELQKARDELGDGVSEQLSLWQRLDQLAALAQERARAAVAASGDGEGWRTSDLGRLGKVIQVQDPVAEAIRVRDVEGARRAVAEASLPLSMARRAVQQEARRVRPPGEAVPDGVAVAERALREVKDADTELRSLLDQIQDQPEQDNTAVRERAKELSEQQRKLHDRAEGLAPTVQQIEQALPTGDGTATQAMKQGIQAMERAQDALEQGAAMPAQGHQQDAGSQLGEASRQLQRQAEEARQMQQQVQKMRNQDGQGDKPKEGENGDSDRNPQVEIPAPERFMSPEAYRRALLEGMQSDVPDEFEALKRRYYEDLVRQ